MQKTILKNVKGQQEHMKSLLWNLLKDLEKLQKGSIDEAVINIWRMQKSIEAIQNQVDATNKVVSKFMNDMSLIQIQLKLIEDLRKEGFSGEAVKLTNVKVDLKKFNAHWAFQRYGISEKNKQ